MKKKINLQCKNRTLYEILSNLSQQSNTNFSYNADKINGDSLITIDITDKPLEEVLYTIFPKDKYFFNLIGKHIVIQEIKKENTFQNNRDSLSFIEIRGKIVDHKDKPVPYATIAILGKNSGTIANMEGRFAIRVPRNKFNDTLCFSHLGFEPFYLRIPNNDIKETTIQLEKKLFSLQEVIVWSGDATEFVKKSIDEKKHNYFDTPTELTGFYRETIRLKDWIKNISEAVIKIQKTPKKIGPTHKVKILKARKFTDYDRKDSLDLKLKAGLNSIFQLDFVDQGISFFSKSSLHLYNFEIKKITSLYGEHTLAIYFYPKNTDYDYILFEGTMYINTTNYALIAANFKLTNRSLKKVENSLIVRKDWGIKAWPEKISYFVQYQRTTDKYTLSNIRGELEFKIKRGKQLFPKNYNVNYEMVVTHTDTTSNIKFNKKEVINPNMVFIEQITDYDPSFWSNYNFIRPDKTLIESIKKIGVNISELKEL